MKIDSFIMIAVVLTLGTSKAVAEDALVIAQPKKVEFVMAEGDLPENQGSGKIYLGGVYRTTIVVQQVLHGALTQKLIIVNLVATSRKNLTEAASILVLLSPGKDGEFRAVGWDELRTIACLPNSLASKSGLAETLPLELTTSNERCVYVK